MLDETELHLGTDVAVPGLAPRPHAGSPARGYIEPAPGWV